MNWTKAIAAGLAGGVVLMIAGFVLHALILGPTYAKYPEVFNQDPANPVWFLLISVCISVVAAIAFALSRPSWKKGWQGGAVFGLLVGLVVGFTNFNWPIVIDGFPYFLAWCWIGVDAISYSLTGLVIGLVYRAP